ncbi:MAG: oxidoreductase [Alphaproteobacteria bacterium]
MAKPLADSGFKNWTPDRLSDLAGKRYLITGGNSGLGFEAARMLAVRNADIVIASRNAAKAERAAAELGELGAGKIEAVALELSRLDSVRKAAEEIRRRYDGLDAIANNAGIMQVPEQKSADGFELQLATNHLGHFLLDGLLFDLVEKRKGRIVAVSSVMHKRGHMHFDDLMLSNNYSPTRAYAQSKLANLMFAIELDRRLKASASPVTAIACHPGYAATNLQMSGPTGMMRALYVVLNRLVAQPAKAGAVSLVLAAAGTEAKAGAFYGPTGMAEARGPVGDAIAIDEALDQGAAARLWAESERLVGFDWGDVLPRGPV